MLHDAREHSVRLLSLPHALQPEQLIARLPPAYYVVLPEVNADTSALFSMRLSMFRCSTPSIWTTTACCDSASLAAEQCQRPMWQAAVRLPGASACLLYIIRMTCCKDLPTCAILAALARGVAGQDPRGPRLQHHICPLAAHAPRARGDLCARRHDGGGHCHAAGWPAGECSHSTSGQMHLTNWTYSPKPDCSMVSLCVSAICSMHAGCRALSKLRAPPGLLLIAAGRGTTHLRSTTSRADVMMAFSDTNQTLSLQERRFKAQYDNIRIKYAGAMGPNGSALVQRLGISLGDYAHAAMGVSGRGHCWGSTLAGHGAGCMHVYLLEGAAFRMR